MDAIASIVILTHNNRIFIRQCLENIYATSDELEFEVILVDNGSEDGTREYIKDVTEAHPNIFFIPNTTNEGFVRGYNLGAEAATGEYLVFLNNEVVVTKGWLSGLIQHLQDPSIGMVRPVVSSYVNESQISPDYEGQAIVEAFANRHTAAQGSETLELPALALYCIALRCQVFKEIGPLDEQFGLATFVYDDFALRLKAKGFNILRAEDVFIRYESSAHFSKISTTKYWSTFRDNLTKFEGKWGRRRLPQFYRSEVHQEHIRSMLDGAVWLGSQIANRDLLIANLQTIIEERNHQLCAMELHVAERDLKLNDIWAQLSERDLYIAEINRSRAWRLVRWLWRIRLFILPHGSLGERLLHWSVDSLLFLKNNSLAALLMQVKSKFWRARVFQPAKSMLLRILPQSGIQFYKELRYEYTNIDRSRVVLYAEPSILPAYDPRLPLDTVADRKPSELKVSLISTARNEAQNARDWLDSLTQQTRRPDEVVITDGGSTDSTVELIRDFARSAPFEVRVIEAPGANISKGRNIAIQNANYPIIACTDFGCTLEKNWLREILKPFELDDHIQVSGGYSQNSTQNEHDSLYARFFIRDLAEINPQHFLPSSRSLAMKKTFWARVGGYPEWITDAAEDTFFDVQAKSHSALWAFVPSALVYWRAPNTPKKIIRTIYRYSRGDGEVGLFASQYWHKIMGVLSIAFAMFVALLVLVLAAIVVKFWILLLVGILIATGVFQSLRKIHSTSAQLGVGMKMTLNYMIVSRLINTAQVIGFAKGVLNRGRVRQRQAEQYRDELQQILAQHTDRRGVIVYPPTHDWGFMFQRPHQMARAFARQGFLYFFCTNNEKTDAVVGFQEMERGLYLCHVPIEIFRLIDRLIVYIGSPWHRELISRLGAPPFIYDHYDDLKVSSANVDDHAWLLQHADLVLVTSQLLMDNVLPKRPDSLLAPNGVDYTYIHGHRPRIEEKIPPDLEPILEKGGPIIGYSGALADWFDYELISHLARSKPHMQFVLLGTNYDGSLDRSRILEIHNIHWLGMKSYEDLYDYMWRFDIGIIPFKVNEITLATSPIKQFEYMACAKPVVSTALPECKSYANVFVAESYEEFANHLESALRAKLDPVYLTSLLETAQQNTWESRVSAIIARLLI